MIHPSSFVSEKAKIGHNVKIGPFTTIHDNVIIGDNTTIGGYCELGVPTPLSDGSPLSIGANSTIRSHSVFYEGAQLGERLVTGHRVVVRELTKAGKSFQIGTQGDIQGHCEIGDCVRFQSNVFVAQGARIGNFVWIFPNVVLTNDPHPPSETEMGVTLEDFAAIAAMSVILPGVTVGRGALVGANSTVTRDVEPDTVVAGSPAKFICETSKIKLRGNPEQSAYPWRRHFHRGYPEDVVAQWKAEFADS